MCFLRGKNGLFKILFSELRASKRYFQTSYMYILLGLLMLQISTVVHILLDYYVDYSFHIVNDVNAYGRQCPSVRRVIVEPAEWISVTFGNMIYPGSFGKFNFGSHVVIHNS